MLDDAVLDVRLFGREASEEGVVDAELLGEAIVTGAIEGTATCAQPEVGGVAMRGAGAGVPPQPGPLDLNIYELVAIAAGLTNLAHRSAIGRAACRERVCQYAEISMGAGSLK